MTLIDELVDELRPVRPARFVPSVGPWLAAGAALSVWIIAVTLGIQPDLMTVAHGAPFAMKVAYSGTLTLIALSALSVLSFPGREAPEWRWLALPFALLAALAAAQLFLRAEEPVSQQWLGTSWFQCPIRIGAFAAPIMAALMIAVRRQAPTKLRLTGAAVGLASGALGASLYALACTENTAAFVLAWYSLGIGAPALVGAMLGPWSLRW